MRPLIDGPELLADLQRRESALTLLIHASLDLSMTRERLTAKREGLRIAIDLARASS